MNMQTRLLNADDDQAYEALVLQRTTGLLYAAPVWRDVLMRLRSDFTPAYIGCFEGQRLVGALPGMVVNGPLGAVFNSLPFFGSNGGLLVDLDADRRMIARALFDALNALALERSLVSSTVISNPLEPLANLYDEFAGATATDDRIGQVSVIPGPYGDVEAALMAGFHSKTRNVVRKGLSGGLVFECDNSIEAFRALYEIHVENMAAISGLAKPWRVFVTLREVLRAGDQYQIFVARDRGVIVAALLVLYYNFTAEYFTPATRASHRTFQPLSALILHAMADASRRGLRYWNWGGTWVTQNGVYLFKSRWGTKDMPYRYYVREYPAGALLRNASKEELVKGYPMCFVFPFAELRS